MPIVEDKVLPPNRHVSIKGDKKKKQKLLPSIYR
jgi:hypothetical protein